jgi:uncharacterized membrane protein (UPF0127 family)
MRNFLLASAALVLFAGGVWFFAMKPTSPQPSSLPTAAVTLGGVTVVAELATTPEQKQQGLSGRTELSEGKGMLFVFDPPQTPGFWMKDMYLSLDIIFADKEGTIITIYPDLAPSTYPQSFRPTKPAYYVLEVPAGFAARHGIAVGDKIVVQ